jgi:response regulator RpfG family c-di-GMP phosphodiesterase
MSRPEPAQPKILLLDDDEIILLAIKETLGREDYDISTFSKAGEALEALKSDPYAVIVSDQRMPEMTGLEFLHESKSVQPNASRILITGVLTLNTVIDAVNKGEIYRFLAKPWIREELIATIRNAVQRYQLLEANEKLREDTLHLNDELVQANAQLQQKVEQLTAGKEALDRANHALRENFEHSLELCHRLIETFHPVLGRQTKSVATICREMADASNLPDETRDVLMTSAWLHNIGMVGIPRQICSKSLKSPAGLTEPERQLLRHHPIYGQTLAAFVNDLRAVGETIRAHHERFDGRGYPDGLSGQQIPEAARILSVAVGFVESNLSRDAAIEQILHESGQAFDPEYVRLFLKVSNRTALPRKVREITLDELEPGMVLARGIYTPSGLLLISEDKVLTPLTVGKIREHNAVTPITQRLLIFQPD